MIPKCVHPLDQLHDDACELVGEPNSFQLQILKLLIFRMDILRIGWLDYLNLKFQHTYSIELLFEGDC